VNDDRDDHAIPDVDRQMIVKQSGDHLTH
jgi:hypothetical protein